MLKKLINNKGRVLLFILLVGVLAVIRAFEEVLFYDPFLAFFRSEYTNQPFPQFNGLWLFASMMFRYFLNSTISLAIIFVIFKDRELVQFASFLYFVFFTILIIAFFAILIYFAERNYFALYYVRRFLIQPLFVILFIPAFYYQSRVLKK